MQPVRFDVHVEPIAYDPSTGRCERCDSTGLIVSHAFVAVGQQARLQSVRICLACPTTG